MRVTLRTNRAKLSSCRSASFIAFIAAAVLVLAHSPSSRADEDLESLETNPRKHPTLHQHKPAKPKSGRAAPFQRRQATSRQFVWIDLGLHYWMYDLYQSAYSLMPPYIQTGTFGPQVIIGLQRLVLQAEYGQAKAWFKTIEEGLEDKGTGPIKRWDISGGIEFFEQLGLHAGAFSNTSTFSTKLGMNPGGDWHGYYIALRHAFPVALNQKHAFKYCLQWAPFVFQTKSIALSGSLSLPDVEKKGNGAKAGFFYTYALDAPLLLSMGLMAEAYWVREVSDGQDNASLMEAGMADIDQRDLTIFYGPQLQLTWKL